jgi:hypothetical protein
VVVRKVTTSGATFTYDLKTFSPKNLAKKLTFFSQTTGSFFEKFITAMVFEKNAHFLPKIVKNRRKL